MTFFETAKKIQNVMSFFFKNVRKISLLIWLNVFLKHLMLISFTLQNFMYDVKPRKIKNNLISMIIHVIPQCNQTLKSDWSLIG